MDPHDKLILWSSNESNYRTPPACFNKLNDEFLFNLEAAADRESRLTQVWFGPGQFDGTTINGLTADWTSVKDEFGKTVVFLNPPFSKTLVNAYNTGRIKAKPGNLSSSWVDHPIDREMAKVYDVENWARKCWEESRRGCTVVGIFPFAPQTDWYRSYIMGHVQGEIEDGRYPITWNGHAAMQERRLPHRISFLKPDGTPTGNAGVNSVIVVWQPNCGIVGPWQPHSFYWSYREAA